MKKHWRISAAATILMITTNVANSVFPSGSAQDEAQSGEDVYANRCQMCHGESGEGNEQMAKAMGVTFPHLGAEQTQNKTDEELSKIINEGTGEMRPVRDLSPEDVSAIIAQVRKFKNE